ncbi:hypothetical protein MTR67_026546 [Solanum verrucosum]|uniref:Uncharacterized protein n=1 Tax=Solanum verrucosum TaxID=315347 RepID=A0AAF0R7E9_SOLVR|nr:hypothetical protein MTR67_026546 [Solanum verrucosum]
MPNDGRERLNSRFSITMQRTRYLELNNSKLNNFNDTTNFKNAQLIRFMRDYGHEQLNSRTQDFSTHVVHELNTQDLELEYTIPLKCTQFMKFIQNVWHERLEDLHNNMKLMYPSFFILILTCSSLETSY